MTLYSLTWFLIPGLIWARIDSERKTQLFETGNYIMAGLVFPILIYDNLCYSCTKFARLANNLVQGKCEIIGHYTTRGKEIKNQLFPQDYDGIEMSWFIIDGHAYGGRAGLLRIIQYILFDKKKGQYPNNEFRLTECTTDCKTVKGVFLRSHSIITNYKKFSVPQK